MAGRAPIVRLAAQLGVRRRGLIVEIANTLGIQTSSVCGWQQVPPERVPAVARILGVERHQLRPDLWEPPQHCPSKFTTPEPSIA